MRKIIFLIGSYNNSGGTERVTSQIANGLAARGYEISIVSIERGLNPHFETDRRINLVELGQNEKFLGNRTLPIIVNKIMFRFWSLNKIATIKKEFEKKVKAIAPELVIAVDIQCYRVIDSFRKKYHYKTIGWEHFSLHTLNGFGVNYSRYLAIKHASQVLVLSDNDLQDYHAKYPKANNLMRIHNPLAFTPIHNSDMNNKIVIAAGRYTAQKGFDYLIEAWSRIANEVSDWELRIFGAGEDEEKLNNLISKYKLKSIKLLPYTKNLDREMSKASIYALSSRFEGWGLVLIEAQAMGLPCVSFNCKHGPSEIITDNVNGFLVKPGDVNGFADKLLELMKNDELRQEFSDNAQKDLHKFEINNIIGQWIKMLNSI